MSIYDLPDARDAILKNDAAALEAHIPTLSEKHCGFLLRYAAEENSMECVRVLLPHSNPKDMKSAALRQACLNGNEHIFELLYPLSDAMVALQTMQEQDATSEMLEMLQARVAADQERHTLEQATDGFNAEQHQTKKKM